jgi:hypothetical protein
MMMMMKIPKYKYKLMMDLFKVYQNLKIKTIILVLFIQKEVKEIFLFEFEIINRDR